jgi:hypothetical protein
MTFLDFWYKVQFNLYTSTNLQSTYFWGGQLHNRLSISWIFFHNIWLCSWSIGGRVNSCVNPIVYGFMSKNFRKAYVVALGFMCLGRRRRAQFRNKSIVRFSIDNRFSINVPIHQQTASPKFLRENFGMSTTYTSPMNNEGDENFSIKRSEN